MLSKFLNVEAIKENVWVVYAFVNDKLDELLLSKIKSGEYSTKQVLGGTVVVLFVGSTFFKWLKMRNYFKRLGIQGPTPLPIVGNFFGLLRKGIDGHDTELLQKYNRTCGYFEGSTPVILTSDPKFIKDVMIKDAGSFVNRRVFDGLLIDPADKFLTVLKDEEWKNVRSILTTTFTSGKLKELAKLIRSCSKNADAFVNKLSKKDEEFNAKTLFGSFTLDVISSCLFGFEANSLENPDNEFIKHLQVLFSNTLSSKLALLFLFPNFSKFLADRNMVEFFPSSSMNFLKNVSEQIINRRRAKLETRADFIQNMVEHEDMVKSEAKAEEATAKTDETGSKWKSMKKTLTNKEILSQAVLFLAAGYETTASNLTLVAYNLAMHPEYQEKLCEEVDEVLQRHKGEINYDSIGELKYMEQVINETLRLYPPALRTDRVCNEDYEYNGMKIPKGSIWTACIWALHHDPEFYPEPEKFMPERFSEDAKKARDNEAFLPFGGGQRICIGMRFALIEMKIVLAELLSKYKFVSCDKTPKKIKIDNSGLARPIQPIILKIKARS